MEEVNVEEADVAAVAAAAKSSKKKAIKQMPLDEALNREETRVRVMIQSLKEIGKSQHVST